jgi:hypothetical protein
MIALVLTGLWSRISGYVVAAGAAVMAMGAIYTSGLRRGRQNAERRALGKDLEHVEVRSRTERHVSRVDDPARELQQRWRRD